MSVHLIECAAEIQLPPALKLTLLCFADSGSADGRIARPGLDRLMVWTGLKRSRQLEVVKHLEELQFLAPHRRAYRGQRAEYVVFPNGCCDRHGKASATVLRSVDNFGEPLTCDVANGSGTADPFSAVALSTGSGTSDPVSSNGSDPAGGMGPISGSEWVRSPRSKVEPSKYLPPTDQLPVVPDPQQLPSREPSVVATFDFTSSARQPVGRQMQPTGSALGCRNCDAGFVCDSDGLPVSKCPHCHPAHRSRGATA